VHPSLEVRVEELRSDRRTGASSLARRAVEALLEAIEAGSDPVEAARALAGARPAMGAIAGALGRVLAVGPEPERVVEEARALIAQRDRAAKAIAVLLGPDLHGTVMTHSASATVREAVLHTPPAKLVCTVSEPFAEGRPFAEELRAEGLAVELVDDEDGPHAVKTVGLLLLGADTVYRDGSLVNKVRTRALAEAANRAGVPVFVACETFKLAPFDPPEPPEEDLFELTPAELIDRYVTEEGACAADDVASLVDRTPLLREGYVRLSA
jgi:translation initiation factor 2B subunit (eIF-2B alpha/beta/delta family)